ncbi:Gfo/Idh/MocA family oxidoreductase [Anaerolineae bacterium CFX9]|nr:Gfo/Idh/MocA family oxidoreductase [Anaerolineae bacterium CFX9]
MTRTIRWGILSTARIGATRLIPAIRAAQNAEVAAVASRSLEKARTFAAANDIPKAFGSYEELLASPEIDAIYIPLPNSEHAIWSIRCAEAGKPTLCEKPLASNAEEARRMVEAFEARGVPFAEAFMYRFHPQHQRVKSLIADGAIGQMRLISASFTFPIRSEENIRLSAALAGGALMDVGCYCISAMRHLTGEEPQQVLALASFGAVSGVDETISGVLRFPSGVMGHFDASLRAFKVHTYEVRGTEGRLQVERAFNPENDDTIIRYWRDEDYREITIPGDNQYRLMIEDFSDAILTGRSPRYPAQDSVNNMRVIDDLLASARANTAR